jgi:uncharacterized RDD family membrane protein YckC
MKCPKCGYLGFETTDRCRNCQYDFSLAPFASDPELTLHGAEHKRESANDFDLPSMTRPGDALSPMALDLDRLFGDPQPLTSTAPAPPPAERAFEPEVTLMDAENPEPVEAFKGLDDWESNAHEHGERVDDSAPAITISVQREPEVPSTDEGALPFDDAPLMPPPAARTPLAVRRSTPDIPRNRPRTTRPVRTDSLQLESTPSTSGDAAQAAADTVALLLEMPTLAVRVGAGLIDLLLLIGIDAAVVYLTLRVTGLQNSLEDLRVLPTIPFVGFLAILSFGYVAAFTVAGGQTIGKMLLSLRVIGDDGRPVDAAGGMLRALGCMLVPITFGLSYLPALFTSDHRALHDRLAGTRVVQE